MVQRNSHTVSFMSTFFFFFPLVKDEPSLFSSATCAVFNQFVLKFLSAFFRKLSFSRKRRRWTFSQLPASALVYWLRYFHLSINRVFVWKEPSGINTRNFSKLPSQTALIFSAALSLLFPMLSFATKLSTNWVIFLTNYRAPKKRDHVTSTSRPTKVVILIKTNAWTQLPAAY